MNIKYKRKMFFFTQKIFEYYCRLVFIFYTPLKIFGKENIPNSSAVLCSNHRSHMDTALLAIGTGRGFTKLGMLAAKDYWFDNNWRFFLINSFLNLIPVDRNKNSSERITLDETIDACNNFIASKKDRGIVIYPEGTRSYTSELLPFKDGAAIFSAKLQLPLIPIYIKGALEAWPKGKFFIRPKKIKIFIGKPIYPSNVIPKEDLEKWDKKEIKPYIKLLTEALEKEMTQMKKKYEKK